MAVTWKDDQGHVLSSTPSTVLTFSANALTGGAKVLGATVTTIGATTRTVTIWLIPTGQAASNTYVIYKGPTLANDTYPIPGGPWAASASAFVQAQQDAGTDVTIRIHAFEET